MQQWLALGEGLLDRLAQAIWGRGVHPARTVVVLPFAHLRPLAARLWAQRFPDGFAPRFETSMSWSTSLSPWSAGPTDIAFDAALDSLTAQAMLEQVGLGEQSAALTVLLVQVAHQIGPLAAAVPAERRGQWAVAARAAVVLGMDSTALAWEAAVGQVAVEWAAVSTYASDVLLSPQTSTTTDAVLVVQGLALDPIAAGLLEAWRGKAEVIPFSAPNELAPADVTAKPKQRAHLGTQLHSCLDAEDEAQRAAACLIRHIADGRFPVALVSSDRALTRRVRAMLEASEVQIRDETGWKLSTSHGAAQVMALLRACAWNASTDDVLAWLKGAPTYARMASEVEALARREQLRDWRKFSACSALKKQAHLLVAHSGIEQQRARFKGVRPLQAWLAELRLALQESGIWDTLQPDNIDSETAKHSLIEVLRLSSPSTPEWDALQTDALWAGHRFDLAGFTTWVNQTFEGASASPAYPALEQVVILPMSQMMGRPFAALVMAGCDEVRLNPSTDPPGNWTAAQREALGLPSREQLEEQSRWAWLGALATPSCDVLWRTSDDAGETLQPSVLVQLLQLDIAMSGAPEMASACEDPRSVRHVPAQPVARPMPIGADVLPAQLSASAYEDLRTCPYRFFAMRQLGLQASDELDAEVDKRDFGLWLHEVLKRFHEGLQIEPTSDRARRTTMLQAASEHSTLSMGLSEGEFLPFAAAWPAVREHYLDWCETHDRTNARFASAETSHTQNLGPITLVGRIDRIDTLPDGSHWVMDYKTEPMAKTQARIKDPFEDTQIAFYAALLPDDTLDAAYVNISERDATRTVPQADIVQARDALLEAILEDMTQIQSGAALPALGEGMACDYCKARGLCRKDFWEAP
ncbi:PD-(D/E)XK nuclease family protein [Rhodoferax aquaticus]|uniref:PD-(D/E)XK nuclease family protein n=2 Tax=Rhodoferax aquaticus TaxID=2527691 RepID=A0A515EVT1_9BURK|nr:PD-(D/E)XK nuclease family protein [Rhodoferax aquaticus]